MSDIDPKLQRVLDQIKQFGFEFYGHDENGIPLVKGPNDQVADINVAIRFVNSQIESQKQGGGSVESGPVMNQNLDASINVEQSIETKLEEQSNQSDDKNDETQTTDPQGEYKVRHNAPKIKLSTPKNNLYGDGFDPQTFDPSNIRSALNFIEKNSKKNNTKSDKWLAILFDKFVREQQMGLKNQ